MTLGIIAGILVLSIIYIITMIGYFQFRKKYAGAKYLVETITIGIALVFSIIIKFLILKQSNDSFTNGFATFLYALYSGFGGLAFEGLNEVSEIESSLLQCLYTGSSLYAGLMFVSVISAKASYELFSIIQLKIIGARLTISPRFASKMDLFIFTSVTEDSLLLAKNIKNKYEYDQKNEPKNPLDSKKGRKLTIIFTGDQLENFDRTNIFHREIMSNGYIYWSFFKADVSSKYVSLLKRFGLYINNDFCIDVEEKNEEFNDSNLSEKDKRVLKLKQEKENKKIRKINNKKKTRISRIHIFALGNNENLSGLESNNSDTIFDEISSMTFEMMKKKNKTIVDLYILTDKDINYEYYQNEIKRRVKNVLLESNNKVTDEEVSKMERYFQLHIINEALLAGKDLSEQRIAIFEMEDKPDTESLFISDNEPNIDNTFRAIILGFGMNGQQAMNSIFIDTSYVNQDGVPSLFIADVFDSVAEEKAGLFSNTHPMFICVDCESDIPVSVDDEVVKEHYDKISALYTEENTKNKSTSDKIKTFDDVNMYMQFPIVAFHRSSCFNMPLLDYLDKKTGNDGQNINRSLYNVFVIALGNDEDNIMMANLLIDDIKHESSYINGKRNVYPQTIYVNIRNEKNYQRINWTLDDILSCANLKVVIFGNRQKIYSYEQIIDKTQDMRYNYAYETVVSDDMKEIFDQMKSVMDKKNASVDYSEMIKEANRRIKLINPLEFRQKWLSIPIFKKESNNNAKRFGIYFQKRLMQNQKITGKELLNYTELEHNRWNRFYMANGWIFILYKEFDNNIDKATRKKLAKAEKLLRENRKEHRYICPFEMLDDGIKAYDVVNVTLAYKETK